MKAIIAAIIWGVVSSTMVCKTSGSPMEFGPRMPWSN